MSSWSDDLPRRDHLEDFVARVDGDPNVAGVILTGSWVHGTATEFSDVDVTVVLRAPSDQWRPRDEGGLDITVTDLARLARIPSDPGRWWDRYVMVRVKVLLDRTDGRLPALVLPWGTLNAQETQDAIDFYLDPYLTYSRRSLKNRRDGRDEAAHYDAVEGLAWTVRLMFAVHSRVRPINAYLKWELENHPFADPQWSTPRILGLLDRVLEHGDPAALREIWSLVEPKLLHHGFGGALNVWGDELTILRTPAVTTATTPAARAGVTGSAQATARV